MRAGLPSLATQLRWFGGPIVWAAHFLLVYASESLICSRGGGAGGHLLVVGAASAAAVAVLLAVIVNSDRRARAAQDRPGERFMDHVAVTLGFLGLIAVLWTALPATLVPACSPPA